MNQEQTHAKLKKKQREEANTCPTGPGLFIVFVGESFFKQTLRITHAIGNQIITQGGTTFYCETFFLLLAKIDLQQKKIVSATKHE
jgi:hypothetical protein